MKINKRNLWLDYVPMAVTAGLIIYFAVVKNQSLLRTLPTLITLAVQILLARANRAAFLLGGANSVLYGLSYASNHLYFESFFAIAISAPMQIYSYFNWKKNSSGGKPKIRQLSLRDKALVALATTALWLVCLKYIGCLISGSHIVLDSLVFSLGLVTTLLSAFRFVDAQYVSLLSSLISLSLWIIMAIENPENANYVVISVYNLFRGIEITLSWLKLCPEGRLIKSKKLIKEGDSK